jgi:hypothetical protein
MLWRLLRDPSASDAACCMVSVFLCMEASTRVMYDGMAAATGNLESQIHCMKRREERMTRVACTDFCAYDGSLSRENWRF